MAVVTTGLTPAQSAAFELVQIAYGQYYNREVKKYGIFNILEAYSLADDDCEVATVTFVIVPQIPQDVQACKTSLEQGTGFPLKYPLKMANDGTLYAQFEELVHVGHQAEVLRRIMALWWVKSVVPH